MRSSGAYGQDALNTREAPSVAEVQFNTCSIANTDHNDNSLIFLCKTHNLYIQFKLALSAAALVVSVHMLTDIVGDGAARLSFKESDLIVGYVLASLGEKRHYRNYFFVSRVTTQHCPHSTLPSLKT